MELRNYEALRIVVLQIASEEVIRTSGEEYGISWDRELWSDGSSF